MTAERTGLWRRARPLRRAGSRSRRRPPTRRCSGSGVPRWNGAVGDMRGRDREPRGDRLLGRARVRGRRPRRVPARPRPISRSALARGSWRWRAPWPAGGAKARTPAGLHSELAVVATEARDRRRRGRARTRQHLDRDSFRPAGGPAPGSGGGARAEARRPMRWPPACCCATATRLRRLALITDAESRGDVSPLLTYLKAQALAATGTGRSRGVDAPRRGR